LELINNEFGGFVNREKCPAARVKLA
jgi:hypothetical protein